MLLGKDLRLSCFCKRMREGNKQKNCNFSVDVMGFGSCSERYLKQPNNSSAFGQL